MKERYIQGKLDNIKKKLAEVKSKKETAKLITGLATIGTTVFTIATTFSFPPFALASLVATGALGIAYYNFEKKYDEETNRLMKEQSHLEEIRKKTPEASTKLNQKRLKKLKALEDTYKKQKESYNTASGINVGLRVAEVVGAGLTFANPWLSLIGFGGIALNLISSKYMNDKKRDMENTLLRYNNITNDLQTIMNDERDQQAERISNRKVMKPEKAKTKQKTKQKPLPGKGTNVLTQPTQVYKPLPSKSNNQQAVNKYVDNLANQKQKNIPNQKIKK